MGMICGFMERKILYLFQELGNNLPKTEKKHLQQGFVNAITIKIYRSQEAGNFFRYFVRSKMKNGGSSTKPEEIELYNKRVSRQTKTWSIDESHFSTYMSTGSHRYMNVSNNY